MGKKSYTKNAKENSTLIYNNILFIFRISAILCVEEYHQLIILTLEVFGFCNGFSDNRVGIVYGVGN